MPLPKELLDEWLNRLRPENVISGGSLNTIGIGPSVLGVLSEILVEKGEIKKSVFDVHVIYHFANEDSLSAIDPKYISYADQIVINMLENKNKSLEEIKAKILELKEING